MELDDLNDERLLQRLRKTNKNYVKKMNASLRGSSDEEVAMTIPVGIPMNIGGVNYLAKPISVGESGGNFMDFVKSVVSIPAKIVSAPLAAVKSVVGLGEGASAPAKKPRKPRAKKAKGGNLLETLMEAASDIPNMSGIKTPLDEFIPKGIQKEVSKAILGKGESEPCVKAEPVKAEAAKVETTKAARKPNKWIIHLNSEKAKHPNMSLKEVMKIAKLSYTK